MDMRCAESLADARLDFDGDIPDRHLVDLVQYGHRSAFEQLVRRHQERFVRLAFRYLDNEADAQDVVQLAFVKIHRHLDGFRGDAKFKNWAYRIVVNTALSQIRKQNRRSEVAFDKLGALADRDDQPVVTLASWRARADETARDHELRQRLGEAVAELQPKYKKIFLLYEIDGLSIDDISETVDLTVPGVKSRLHRARLHLRATLQDTFDQRVGTP